MENAAALEQGLTSAYPYSYSLEFTASTVEKIRAKLAPLRFRLAAETIIEELGIKPEDKVLEIGSGLGLLGQGIKRKVGSKLAYLSLDLCLGSLRQNNAELLPIQANAVKLPFADDSFEKLVTTDVLEHIPQATQAVTEIWRVLKPGGRAFLVIADPSEARFSSVTNHLKRSLEKTDVDWWEGLLAGRGFKVLNEASNKYRSRDWRRIFNLPFLARFKDRLGFACAFNPVNRPGVYIVEKPN